MQSRVGTIVVAAVVGTICALVAGRWTREDVHPRVAVAARSADIPSHPVRPPPGWNPQFVEPRNERTEHVEVTEPEAAPTEREQMRVEQYKREVDAQHVRLADHDREPIDATWSRESADQLSAHVAELGLVAQHIDCRSMTCVVSLQFTTPSDALSFMGTSKLDHLTGTLSGMIVTPLPPDSDGAYTLPIVITR